MGSTGGSTITPASNNVTIHWKGHADILAKGITDLYKSQYLVDTEVSIRGDCVKAHKMILALFLPTFKKSVDDLKGQLHGLNLDFVADDTEDVRALIEFVYTGTVSVSKDRLGHLGRLAECLQFEGLSRAIGQLCDVEGTILSSTDESVVAPIMPAIFDPEVCIKEEPDEDMPTEEAESHADEVNSSARQGRPSSSTITVQNDSWDMESNTSLPRMRSVLRNNKGRFIVHHPSTTCPTSLTMPTSSSLFAAAAANHACSMCNTIYDSAKSHCCHHFKYHKNTPSYKCHACALEFVRAGASGQLASRSVDAATSIVSRQSEREPNREVRVGGDYSITANDVHVSSAGDFLKVQLQEVKPDPDAGTGPTGPIEEGVPREYGCAFCTTFKSLDRDAWTKHLAEAHQFVHPSIDEKPNIRLERTADTRPTSSADQQRAANYANGYGCPKCSFRFPTTERRDRHIRWKHPSFDKKRSFSDMEDG